MVPSGGAPIHNGSHGRQELVKNTRTILPSFTWIETASPDWSTPWIRTACCPVRGSRCPMAPGAGSVGDLRLSTDRSCRVKLTGRRYQPCRGVFQVDQPGPGVQVCPPCESE